MQYTSLTHVILHCVSMYKAEWDSSLSLKLILCCITKREPDVSEPPLQDWILITFLLISTDSYCILAAFLGR